MTCATRGDYIVQPPVFNIRWHYARTRAAEPVDTCTLSPFVSRVAQFRFAESLIIAAQPEGVTAYFFRGALRMPPPREAYSRLYRLPRAKIHETTPGDWVFIPGAGGGSVILVSNTASTWVAVSSPTPREGESAPSCWEWIGLPVIFKESPPPHAAYASLALYNAGRHHCPERVLADSYGARADS